MQWNTHTWCRYTVPSGYDLTGNGKITCDDVKKAVLVLEKYYRYNYSVGNRVAVALHNFWNALFLHESTLAFVALVTILETFTNLDKGEKKTTDQIFRNALKLVPFDAHNNAVTEKRLKAMYEARSIIAHGSYGAIGRSPITWGLTHLSAKSSNVDVRLSSDVMSIAVKMLHRVIFDAELMSIIDNTKTAKQEQRAIRRYVNSLPSPKIDNSEEPTRKFIARQLAAFKAFIARVKPR